MEKRSLRIGLARYQGNLGVNRTFLPMAKRKITENMRRSTFKAKGAESMHGQLNFRVPIAFALWVRGHENWCDRARAALIKEFGEPPEKEAPVDTGAADLESE